MINLVNRICRIHYGLHYPGMPYQDRHCKVLRQARGKPFNVLVKLHGGRLLVVPYGNLRET